MQVNSSKRICPNCKDKTVVIVFDQKEIITESDWQLKCTRCGTEGKKAKCVQAAFRNWDNKIFESTLECNCENAKFGFNCSCDFVRKNPGTNKYCCEFCGIYEASKPQCSECEVWDGGIENN